MDLSLLTKWPVFLQNASGNPNVAASSTTGLDGTRAGCATAL